MKGRFRINGSAAAWIALALLVVPMFGSYFFDDMFSTVSNIFNDPSALQLGWGQDEYLLYIKEVEPLRFHLLFYS